MPVSVTYSTTGGGSTERCRIVLTDIVIGEIITFDWDSPATGLTKTYTVAGTDETAEYALLKSNLDAYIATQSGDGFWDSTTTVNGTTYLDLLYPTFVGRISVTSDNGAGGGGGSMTTKIWTGNSVAKAQVTSLTPLNVLTGDTFSVKINGKVISVVATASTAANVAGLLAAAIKASTVPEWREVDAVASGDSVILTARTAGVPFTVSNGSSDAVGVEITTTTAGVPGRSATQVFSVPKSASGTFTVTFGDQTTTDLAIGASASTVQTALQGLSTIGSSNATVAKADSADGNDDVYTVAFAGSLASTPVATLLVDLSSAKPVIRTTQQGSTTGTIQNEIQTIDVGSGAGSSTYTLTLSGQTTAAIAADATADVVTSAITALSNVVSCTVTKSGSLYTVEFTDIDGSANQAQMTASVFSSSVSMSKRLTTTTTDGIVGNNEVQKIAIQGTATGGTFTLTFAGQTTSSIAYNAGASTVSTALQALSSIGSGNVSVTGSAGLWTVTFQGSMAKQNVDQLTATSSLTGSASANVTIATTTASAGPNHWDTADNWLPVGVPATGDNVVFELAAPECLYGLDQNAVTLASLRVSMTWQQGKLGLPRYNDAGYIEYRTRELTCGITSIVIGDGEGSGPQKIALNTGTVQTAIVVQDSGGSSETGVPAVIWRGVHASNTVEVNGGDFGAAWWADETAQVSSVVQRDGTVFLKNTTISDSINCAGQSFHALRCTLGGKPLNV